MTRIYSYTLKLSAFLLRERGGARFRGRWIHMNIYLRGTYILVSEYSSAIITCHQRKFITFETFISAKNNTFTKIHLYSRSGINVVPL